jgi:D-serine deaminase-like pyridoxal phosphate-dependent protein
MLLPDRAARARQVAVATEQLAAAHAAVGGDVVSTGGTGTFDLHTVATEIQAGSYALMDTAYVKLGLPFAPALSVLGTVVSTSARGHAVADVGLKALGMDHGRRRSTTRRCGSSRRARDVRAEASRARRRPRARGLPTSTDDGVPRARARVDGERVVETWLIDSSW